MVKSMTIRRLELSTRFGGFEQFIVEDDWHGRTSRETISFWRISLTVFPYLIKQKQNHIILALLKLRKDNCYFTAFLSLTLNSCLFLSSNIISCFSLRHVFGQSL